MVWDALDGWFYGITCQTFVKFLSYCWGPIPWMIEVAGALLAKFLTGNIIDEKVVFRIDIPYFSFLVRTHKVQA